MKGTHRRGVVGKTKNIWGLYTRDGYAYTVRVSDTKTHTRYNFSTPFNIGYP